MNKLIALLIILVSCFSCSTSNKEDNTSEEYQEEKSNTPPTDTLPIVQLSEEQDSISVNSRLLRDSISKKIPVQLDWKTLEDLSFEERTNDSLEAIIDYPVFGIGPLSHDGLEVQIKGFMIPVAETGNEEIFILSAFPYSQCFFCGQAGLESILDIQLKNKPKRTLELDEQLSFKGTLRLNETDLNYLIYILDDAELIE